MQPRFLRGFLRFLHAEATGGLVLLAMTALALGLANSRWAGDFSALWHRHLTLPPVDGGLTLPLREWVNDGLMSVFFLLVGLEIKRELLAGELASLRRAALPIIAALGGMAAPALIYLGGGQLLHGGAVVRGWAIPTATDIAFTVGVMALLGRRVPIGVKAFVTALAIADDLGAVLIIALFYSAHLQALWLLAALLLTGGLMLLNRLRVRWLSVYLIVGGCLWFAMLRSGIHATIAGVVLGMCVPLRLPGGQDASSPLERLTAALEYPVALGVLPLFALANAGLALPPLALSSLLAPETAGVFFGLILGKPLGISLATLLAVKFGLGDLPAQTGWREIVGAAVLCGIGFTMSIFIGELAFGGGSDHLQRAKLGILSGSVVSALVGAAILSRIPRRERAAIAS